MASRAVSEAPTDPHPDTVIPPQYLHGENARTTTALKKIYHNSGKWPWELIDKVHVPPQWSQNLAEKLLSTMILHSTIAEHVSFDDIAQFLHQTIEARTRKDSKRVLTMSDCDQLRIWLGKKKQDIDGSITDHSRKRDADDAGLSPDTGRRSSRHHTAKGTPLSNPLPLPLTLGASRDKSTETPTPDTALSVLFRGRSESLGTQSLPPTPRSTMPSKVYCSWLSDLKNNATTDLHNAEERLASDNEQLEACIKRKEEITAERSNVEKECSDAKVNRDSVMQSYDQAQALKTGCQAMADRERAEGRECPAEITAILDKYTAEATTLEPSLAVAEAELKTKQDIATKLDIEYNSCDSAIERLAPQIQIDEEQVEKTYCSEQMYILMKRLAEMPHAEVANVTREGIDLFTKFIDEIDERNSAGK
ncbi:hypothetical protein HG530_014610 [Fusarium avenaceum]|nr:hypothetical protein HG530_014610 [Fusarium avenaceum]